jgi:sugar/nucleoside kinase (ribokinase family)
MIYVVGHTAIDHLMQVPVIPVKNSSTLILERHMDFGGGAANIAAGITRLGESCTLISAIGFDFPGSEYDRWMDQLGIQRQFFIRTDLPTAAAFIFTDREGDQVTYFDWGASRAFADAEAPSLPFVHMATADPDFNLRIAEKSGFSSFDPGQDIHRYSKIQLSGILDRISLLFANQHEVLGMCRILNSTEEEIIKRVPIAVFTMGQEGSVLHEQGTSEHIPAVPVERMDPTGAGDAYRAGFLTAYMRGYDAIDCCRIGTITAAFIVEHRGCQKYLPRWEDLQTRYRTYFGAFPEPGSRRW